jgi:DNA-binding CsgD family transcriptional regulator
MAERAAQGLGNKQVADQFGLSEHTVKNYLFWIFEKLEVSNRGRSGGAWCTYKFLRSDVRL